MTEVIAVIKKMRRLEVRNVVVSNKNFSKSLSYTLQRVTKDYFQMVGDSSSFPITLNDMERWFTNPEVDVQIA